MTEDEVHKVARQAVREVFLLLGTDVDIHTEIEQFRESLRMSKTLSKVVDKSFVTILGMIVIACATSVWHHFIGFFK